MHELVFADDGVILAYPSAKDRIRTLKRTGHTLNYRDIDNPLLNAFFQHLPAANAELAERAQPTNAAGRAGVLRPNVDRSPELVARLQRHDCGEYGLPNR